MANLGSFAGDVDLPENLRAWALSGLEVLFLPGGLPRPASEPASASSASVTQDGTSSPERTPSPAAASEAQPCWAQTRGAQTPWPEPWAGLAQRVTVRPHVIITYEALYADLAGRGDPLRRKVFRAVLKYLAWPRGTTLFWPVSVPAEVAPAGCSAADIFMQGVARFNVTHVAAFGAAAAAACSKFYPQNAFDSEVIVHALPAPEELNGLLPHEFQQKLRTLKELHFTA